MGSRKSVVLYKSFNIVSILLFSSLLFFFLFLFLFLFLMASLFSLSPTPFHTLRIGEIEHKLKSGASACHIANNVKREQSYCGFTRGYLTYGSTLKNHSSTSQVGPSRLLLSRALSSTVSTSTDPDQTDCEEQALVVPTYSSEVAFNPVNCLVWVLHESASSFSLSIEALKLTRKDPELAMAWVGVDAQAWHKHVSYQVAVYALLEAVIEVGLIPSHKHNNHPSLVQKILPQITILLGESIESQLNMKQPQLMEWFRTVELPRIAGVFIPLIKKWGMDYAGSGVAGIILAISCCSAAKRIRSARFLNPSFAVSIEDILVELMDLSHSLVSVDKLHHLAIEAGFEEDFLKHFGRKVLPGKDIEEVEFWIGLVQRKLSTAFHRESVILGKQNFNDEVQLKGLATLGLFAFLGRETRLFLSGMGVKNLDEQVKDFLSYLECGSLFMHPEFSSLSEYQLFMEAVTDEIGWLDFYAAFSDTFSEERRLKHDGFQAEQELILCIVYTVCYDVFSGFAHFSNSAKRQLDANLLDFLLRSQSLLSTCLEDYWVSYDKSSELLGIADRAAPDSSLSPETTRRTNSSALLEAYRLQIDMVKSGSHQQGSKLIKWQIGHLTNMDSEMHQEVGLATESESLAGRFLRKSATKLRSASSDVWMGSQLLFVDILNVMGYLMKRIQGLKLTKRERTKTHRTLTDLASLVPITILMLIPISPVGHAALLAAIQKYTPWMIPSPYSPERLDVVKQLRRAKKMEDLTQHHISE